MSYFVNFNLALLPYERSPKQPVGILCIGGESERFLDMDTF